MSKQAIMSWVDALPGVEKTDFQAKRDEIAALVKQAEELVKPTLHPFAWKARQRPTGLRSRSSRSRLAPAGD